eukprot:2419660-Amphidinium_carterae.1
MGEACDSHEASIAGCSLGRTLAALAFTASSQRAICDGCVSSAPEVGIDLAHPSPHDVPSMPQSYANERSARIAIKDHLRKGKCTRCLQQGIWQDHICLPVHFPNSVQGTAS